MNLVPMLPAVGEASLARPPLFWGALSTSMHAVQIYSKDAALVEALESFVREGIGHDEAVILIATPAHREAVESLLARRGIDVERERARRHYVVQDAGEAVREIMADGMPEFARLEECLQRLLEAVRTPGQRVRAFGEMAALLWSRGETAAAVALEMQWNTLCEAERFALFCAYPREGFAREAAESMVEICGLHSRVLPAREI